MAGEILRLVVTVAIVCAVALLVWRLRSQRNECERAQRQLQAQSSHYRDIIDGVNEVVFETDGGGQCTFLNAAWERLTGFSVDETLGRTFLDFVADRRLHPARTVSPQAQSGLCIARFKTKSGEFKWCEVNTRPRSDANGGPAGLHGTLIDVTERLAADMAKRVSELRMRAMFDGAPDGILSIDEKGTIERVNPALLRMLKFREEELIGQPVTILSSIDETGHCGVCVFKRMVTDCPLPRDGARMEASCRRGDGGVLPVEITIAEMQFASGAHFTCLVRDITERKKLDRIKDDFVSTVSHELRTPMAAIVGSLGLIKSGAVGAIPDRALHLIDMAHRNCDRLVRLLNDILDIERIGSGKITLTRASLNLNALIADIVALNTPHAEQRRVTFSIQLSAQPATVFADADRLAQVLTNLISNALKYAPRDSSVHIVNEPSDDGYRVSVRDEGPGIPESFRPQIFSRFARADSSDNRDKGGTGLGLSICKLIIEQHGGRIGFDSLEGHGATFFFELDGTVKAQMQETTIKQPRCQLASARSVA